MSNPNLARRTAVDVAIGGVNITRSIRPYLKSFVYTDNEADQADDIQIVLHDRDAVWTEGWLAEAIEAASAAKLSMDGNIVRENWNGDGRDVLLPCGECELDSVVLSGPPAIITIKGTSLPFSAPVRQTKKNNDWENITLSAIVRDLAGANGMRCMYESAYDPFYKRVEQRQESDIEFLSRLSHNAGISLKATNRIIVLFDQVTYEAKTLAEKLLRLYNKYATSAIFTFPGNPALVAGITVELKGWGAFDGKYIITQAVHRVDDSGYTTQIKLRRVLEGY